MKNSLRITLLSVLTLSTPLMAQTFSDWTPPVNIATLNTSGFEG